MHRPHSKNKTWTNSSESNVKENIVNDNVNEDPNLPGNRWKQVRFVYAVSLSLPCDVIVSLTAPGRER